MLWPVILVIYLLIIDFVDLYPFNDVAKHKAHDRKAELFNYLLISAGALFGWSGLYPLQIAAFLIAAACVIGHLFAWWVPYFFGHYNSYCKEEYEHQFSSTIKILPPIKDHPIPDLEHLPVGLLAIGWAVAAFRLLIS